MNLRKQVEPLWKSRASGFLDQRHAHHAASRLTLMKRWLKRAFRHHAQSRELKRWTDLSAHPVPSARAQNHELSSHEHAIEQFFEFVRPLGDLAVPRAAGVATSEQLVGDVQRG